MAMVYDFIDFCFVIKASDEGATSSKFIMKASHRRFSFNTIIVHMHATSMSVGIDVCQPSISRLHLQTPPVHTPPPSSAIQSLTPGHALAPSSPAWGEELVGGVVQCGSVLQ